MIFESLSSTFNDPYTALKLAFLIGSTPLVFTGMFSSWPLCTRLIYAIVFVAGAFVTCLSPAERTLWHSWVGYIDAVFYSTISGVAGVYVSYLFPATPEVEPLTTRSP